MDSRPRPAFPNPAHPPKSWRGFLSLALAAWVGLIARAESLGAPNTLTPAEKAEGWMLLFDGKSLTGWHKKNDTSTTKSWVIEDSAIANKGTAGHIYSPVMAESFELSAEWKLKDESGNSGIWMRMLESLSEDTRSGPEIQICGNKFPDCVDGKLATGSSYMMYAANPPPSQWVRPAGQWNHFRVLMNGKHVEHWANGVKIVDYEIGSQDWLARQSLGAARIRNPYYGEVHYGHFVLTDHQTPVWYRNLKVRGYGGSPLKPGFKGVDIPTGNLLPPPPKGKVGRVFPLGGFTAYYTLDGRQAWPSRSKAPARTLAALPFWPLP